MGGGLEVTERKGGPVINVHGQVFLGWHGAIESNKHPLSISTLIW